MKSLKTKAVVAFLICLAPLFVLTRTDAENSDGFSNRYHISVVDVVGEAKTVVKQIRIHSKPRVVARIVSDRKGGGGVSVAAGIDADRPDQGAVTVLILADHVKWEAGNVNAFKFLMSATSNGSEATMSDTGPIAAGETLHDLLTVEVQHGHYDYGAAVPILTFKDKTFSLIVEAPQAGK